MESFHLGSGFGGAEVVCWPLIPRFAGSNPAEAVGLAIKILNTPSFGREVKLSVPCRRFAACKRTLGAFDHHFSPIVPPLAARGLPRVVDARGTWRPE